MHAMHSVQLQIKRASMPIYLSSPFSLLLRFRLIAARRPAHKREFGACASSASTVQRLRLKNLVSMHTARIQTERCKTFWC